MMNRLKKERLYWQSELRAQMRWQLDERLYDQLLRQIPTLMGDLSLLRDEEHRALWLVELQLAYLYGDGDEQ